ncbi:MAG: uncharacterized protein JWO36_6968 [Myxococcales bacterium]|nr:uncharacterized protein [Myxococcales bacterium]
MGNMLAGKIWIMMGLLAVVGGCSDDPGTGPGNGLIDGVFTPAEWDKVNMLSPLPAPPANPTNRYADDGAAAWLGQKLFFETNYTGAIFRGTVDHGQIGTCCQIELHGCVSCHDPKNYFIQTSSMPNSLTMAVIGWFKRNSPTLMNNPVYLRWNFWDGRRDTIWANVPNSEGAARASRVHIAHMIYAKYRDAYNAITDGDPNSPPLPSALDLNDPGAARFPIDAGPFSHLQTKKDAWAAMAPADQVIVNRILVNWGKFLEAYVRKLVTPTSPFDSYVAGDLTAISAAAKRGLLLFIGKANCIACHTGPSFSDDKFHNTGIAQSGNIAALLPDPMNAGFGVPDVGRYGAFTHPWGGPTTYAFSSNGMYSDAPAFFDYTGVVQADDQIGQFHTVGLRNVEHTAPYFHAGQSLTLEDVVEFYDRGGDDSGFSGVKDMLILPLHLTVDEKADLVTFLKTLTATKYPDSALLVNTAKPGPVYTTADLPCALDTPPQCTP